MNGPAPKSTLRLLTIKPTCQPKSQYLIYITTKHVTLRRHIVYGNIGQYRLQIRIRYNQKWKTNVLRILHFQNSDIISRCLGSKCGATVIQLRQIVILNKNAQGTHPVTMRALSPLLHTTERYTVCTCRFRTAILTTEASLYPDCVACAADAVP